MLRVRISTTGAQAHSQVRSLNRRTRDRWFSSLKPYKLITLRRPRRHLRWLYSALMRALTALALIFLLPLQLSWAAVVPYYAHESGMSSDFSGLTEVPSKSSHPSGSTQTSSLSISPEVTTHSIEKTSTGSMKSDCEQCHGHFSAVLGMEPENFGIFASGLHDVAPDEFGGAHMSSRPERPQWRPLA